MPLRLMRDADRPDLYAGGGSFGDIYLGAFPGRMQGARSSNPASICPSPRVSNHLTQR